MPAFTPLRRDYAIIAIVAAALGADFFFESLKPALWVAAIVGSLPSFWEALRAIVKERRITIGVFNAFALSVSFVTLEVQSAAFIVLMITSASLLERHSQSRTQNAISELLKIGPEKALRESGGRIEEVAVENIKKDDIIVIENGGRIPMDGVVVFGRALVNEAAITGESLPVEKVVGDGVLSSTLNESGVIKIRATRVGKDSTIEKMAELMRRASNHKSRAEKLADRFAGIFLPVVGLVGLAVWLLTKNITMTASLFLVACADDMAVAIPMALIASLGQAAKKGVIIKGGEWLDILSRMKTLVLDKTGTLTYGTLVINETHIAENFDPKRFWNLVGMAEKFSEHPVGRAVFREAVKHAAAVPDPHKLEVISGGVKAAFGKNEILIGNENILASVNSRLAASIRKKFERDIRAHLKTEFIVIINKKFAGFITVTDQPRREAKASMEKLRVAGVQKILMFTGDNETIAADVAKNIGISEYRAEMKPEDKLAELERLTKTNGPVGMVGDGVNDAPALARADVGIAMGSATNVAMEAADVVILTNDLGRLPEMVDLGRKTISVIRADIAIWALSNAVGFSLVFAGILNPALAAFYNFATDFLPLINSLRLFKVKKE